ncbi:hypothetical protein FA13DRAFT_1636779, partial [Coprinellus micaceus]
GVAEGVCAIVRAARSTKTKGKSDLEQKFPAQHGREFSVGVMEKGTVASAKGGVCPRYVMRKLGSGTPSLELVNGYLSEIARAYGVKWSPPGANEASNRDKSDRSLPFPIGSLTLIQDLETKEDEPGSSEDKAGPDPGESQTPLDGFEPLSQRFAALKRK